MNDKKVRKMDTRVGKKVNEGEKTTKDGRRKKEGKRY